MTILEVVQWLWRKHYIRLLEAHTTLHTLERKHMSYFPDVPHA